MGLRGVTGGEEQRFWERKFRRGQQPLLQGRMGMWRDPRGWPVSELGKL